MAKPSSSRVRQLASAEGFVAIGRQVVSRARARLGLPDRRRARAMAAFFARRLDFADRVRAIGREEVLEFFWYHTVDLGNGLVTPGSFDHRASLASYGFPDDLRGRRVLDVGSATGFFAFEFERRGAAVVSVDVPSIADLDRFPGESTSDTLRKLGQMMPSHAVVDANELARQLEPDNVERFHRTFIDGPFLFCREMLGSAVERRYAAIRDLPAHRSELGAFDLVFLGDVLLHTIDPLGALAAAASFCRDTLVIAQVLPAPEHGAPAMAYVGGDGAGDDRISWWLPNLACLEQIVRKLGFAEVAVVGHVRGTVQPAGAEYTATVVRARRERSRTPEAA